MIEEQLTKGEKLYLKRQRCEVARPRAAMAWHVTTETYADWERDIGGEDIPDVKLGGIEMHEHFAILRRRAGISMQEMARRIGTSTTHVLRFERGRAKGFLPRIQEFWGCQKPR